MIRHTNSDDYVSVTTENTCPFHRKFPGYSYAGCTCSNGYSQRIATPEEERANQQKRERVAAEMQEWLRTHVRR